VAVASKVDLDRDPRAIIATRVIAAPRDLVCEAWTDPKHLAQWWGPAGFTTTTGAFEMKVGGVWRFVMHGPDGRDYETRGHTVAESTIVIDYLDTHYLGGHKLPPADPDRAWQARMWDRFYDHYAQEPMQKIVTDRLRPAGQDDGFGVAHARSQLGEAYAVADRALGDRTWMLGDDFTLADCAAAAALFYANTVEPIGAVHEGLRGYLGRLMTRPSYARVLAEAEPYLHMFPLEPKPRIAVPAKRS
jgi:glutathione S-transferase